MKIESTNFIEGLNLCDLVAKGTMYPCLKMLHTLVAPNTSHKLSKPHSYLKDARVGSSSSML